MVEMIDQREAYAAAAVASEFGGMLGGREVVHLEDPWPHRYLITAAQNNTEVHEALLRNLQVYAAHVGAQLIVGTFMYDTRSRAAGVSKSAPPAYETARFAPELAPYLEERRLALTPSLHFAGELNILPTAEHPLSSLENYSGRASMIVPHAKQTLLSVATPPGTSGAKLCYTTGTVTLRNYIQRKAGLKAEYQHAYGALIVEIDADGRWFVRQIRAHEDGSFQDLDLMVAEGQVMKARIYAIQPGDVHVAQLDPVVRKAIWGRGGMLDTLAPRYQFLHDVLDFQSQNHHDVKNPHQQFRKWAAGRSDVERELRELAEFLSDESYRPGVETVVVGSNHDAALTRWLREADYRQDPANARLHLKLQAVVYAALAAADEDRARFHLLRSVMHGMGVPARVRFLQDDASFVICRGHGGGIECGMHGHAGANGSRGSPRQFSRLGRRTNTGHTHSAAIVGDAFVAGTSSLLRMSYTTGPSSWSHSHIVTYPGGTRTIVTMRDGRWRA